MDENVHHHVHNSSPPDPILSHMNLFYILTHHFFKTVTIAVATAIEAYGKMQHGQVWELVSKVQALAPQHGGSVTVSLHLVCCVVLMEVLLQAALICKMYSAV
jgi:hypothetical protein